MMMIQEEERRIDRNKKNWLIDHWVVAKLQSPVPFLLLSSPLLICWNKWALLLGNVRRSMMMMMFVCMLLLLVVDWRRWPREIPIYIAGCIYFFPMNVTVSVIGSNNIFTNIFWGSRNFSVLLLLPPENCLVMPIWWVVELQSLTNFQRFRLRSPSPKQTPNPAPPLTTTSGI